MAYNPNTDIGDIDLDALPDDDEMDNFDLFDEEQEIAERDNTDESTGLWDSIKDYDYKAAAGDAVGDKIGSYFGGGGSGGSGGGGGMYSLSGESSMTKGDVSSGGSSTGAKFGNMGFTLETNHMIIIGAVLIASLFVLKKR